MANLGKTRPKIVVDSPWSMRVANVNIAYPMDPNALPDTFGPTALNVNGTLELTITNASATVTTSGNSSYIAWSAWRHLPGVDRDGNSWTQVAIPNMHWTSTARLRSGFSISQVPCGRPRRCPKWRLAGLVDRDGVGIR